MIEEYRNNGIATKLIDSGLSIIKDTNIKFIDIDVFLNSKNVINLYKKMGFNEFKISFRKDL